MTLTVELPDEQKDALAAQASAQGLSTEEYARQLLKGSADTLLTKPAGGAPDWSQCPAVESVPGRLNGAWVFRDTRLPVSTVFENLEDGATIDEITEWFRISKEPVIAVLEFAARSVAAPLPRNLRDARSF
jgi:uncharacterized protein (DUF433 family)